MDNEETICRLAKYILERVYVVFVQTDNFISSFRLFNVLNTRGLPLTSSDLIKNKLFEVSENSGNINGKIESYWSSIEDVIGVENIDKFLMLNKISQKKDRDRVVRNLVLEYSEDIENTYKNNAVDFVIDLLKSARNYQMIKDLDIDDFVLYRVFSSLMRLSDEWIPPILSFINRMERDKNIKKGDFKEFVQTFEKSYMHGWFKGLIKSKREIICYSTLVAINTGRSYPEIIDIIRSHADNEGFLSALNGDLYEPTPNKVSLAKAILLRLDQESQDDSVCKTYHGRITIEHILPQRGLANEYWRQRFTEDEHKFWLHKLGNLTLISGSKNSEAQNSSFDTKKEIYLSKNKRVSFDITKEICDYSEWGKTELQERHKKLVKMAQKIWML